jgi:hypothetical protein
LFQLLQAKREQIAAAQAYVQLLQDYWMARATAEQLLAGRLPPRSAVRTASPISSAVAQEAAGH